MSKKTEQNAYDLSGVLDVESLSSVQPGSSLLVSGPAMTGKEKVLRDVLVDGLRQDQGAIGLTTGGRAEDFADDLRSGVDKFDGSAVAVLDCRAESGRENEQLEDGVSAHHVANPSDLTGIGIGVTKAFERLRNGGYDRARLGLTSLSTMLAYADEETVFKFCHVLSSRLGSAEYLGVFTIDSGAHDERTRQVVKQAFDGELELRDLDGNRQMRVRGLGSELSDWYPL